jgi:molybdenum cofactor guanylyltransferase
MTERATLIILAGGRSSRMGQPKHLLSTPRGDTVIEHLFSNLSWLFLETLIVGSDLPKSIADANIRVVQDVYDIRSPLIGIYSGLAASKTDLSFVVACDMPFVRPSLVSYITAMSGNVDVCVPVIKGYYEPLCASYRRKAIPAIQTAIHQGAFKLTAVYKHLQLRTLSEKEVRRFDEDLVSFTNLNVPRQLELLAQL